MLLGTTIRFQKLLNRFSFSLFKFISVYYGGALYIKDKNINILGDGNPKIGAHDKPVVFIHPNDLSGTLVELEET